MKISKVNHTRTAVGKKSSQNGGIIYKTPKQPDAKLNIAKHIQDLNDTARKLYSPFNSGSVDGSFYVSALKKNGEDYINAKNKVRGAEKDIKIKCKQFIIELAKQEKYSLEGFDQALQKKIVERKYDFIDNDFCKNIINENLKRSLKKTIKTDTNKYFIKSIMLRVLLTIARIPLETEITNDEKNILYNVVREDYFKEKQSEKLVKSIENKDTKVQVIDMDGEARLELSSVSNSKKKYISDCIHEYAGNNEDGKRKLLSHQRRVLLLYVCGEDKYNQAENQDLMSNDWAGLLPEDNEEFIDMIRDIMPEDDKEDCAKYKYYYDKMRMEHYGKAVRVEGISDNDIKWIGYFNDEVGKLFKKRNENIIIGSRYIIKYLWKNWVSFIAMKYVDIGKAVYHFAMPKNTKLSEANEIQYGVVQEEYLDGISSFDYERIKAKENISRDMAVYTTFATNVFARATVDASFLEKDKNEDVLSVTEKQYGDALKPNVKRNILQYFGGKSYWENTEIMKEDDNQLFGVVVKALRNVRNTNFHYSSEWDNDCSIDNITKMLFEHEKSNATSVLRKKYYSNNTLMFFEKKDIDSLMSKMYNGQPKREAQIPAFGSIFKKGDCKKFVGRFVISKNKSDVYNGLEQFYSAIYFMLKEIYYYDFLQCADLKKRFFDALKNVNKKESGSNSNSGKIEAKDNFIKYLDEYCVGKSFGELCQAVMTEYNQQNQNIKEVRTRENNDKEIYQHFRMLLYVTLKDAFEDYVLEMAQKPDDKYAFMKKPFYKPDFKEKVSEKDFCNSFTVKMYEEDLLINRDVASIYIMAHFITAKQLNQMQGAIKDYLQFIDNIEARAESTCNKIKKDNEKEHEFYEKVLGVLSVVMLQSGQVSHCFEDYFDSKNEYAEFLLKYVKYAEEKNIKDGNYKFALSAFCNETVGVTDKTNRGKKSGGFANIGAIFAGGQKIGIYYDEMNPIINRNVIQAKLFGVEEKISKLTPVGREDINKYYELKNELATVFKQEKCRTVEEQQKLREYQDLKNMVELYDVTTYTEIMIDCIAQLVSYAYLRERDNMYFQLGYHYMHLYYGKDTVQECEDKLLNISKGAILHQIYAIYDYNTPMITKKDEDYILDGVGQIGAKIGMFFRTYSIAKYLEGMYLFENISMHDILVDRRKYIAHMKYMSKSDASILDMYTWIYNGFFDYDTKFKKSMSYILPNILMKYFVKLELKAEKIESEYTVAKSQYENTKEIKKIQVKETGYKVKSVSAEKFIYKDLIVKETRKPLEHEARSKKFNKNIKALLEM